MQETPVWSWVEKFPWRRDRLPIAVFLGFPGGSDGKESACNAGDLGLIPGLGRSWRREWLPTPAFLPGESPWTEEPGGLHLQGRKESDMTEQLSTAYSTGIGLFVAVMPCFTSYSFIWFGNSSLQNIYIYIYQIYPRYT